MSFVLRDVTVEDDGFLLELYASTRDSELAVTAWSESQKREFVRMQFEAQRTDYLTRFPEAAHSVIIFEGREVGRVWIDRRSDETRLLDITIQPDERNLGIGSLVMTWLQKEATSSAMPLRHSVYASNESALRFYRRHGFVVIEEFGAYVLMEWLPGDLRDE